MKMTGILLALSLWGSVFAVCRLGKIRFWFAPVVAISGIGLFLFAGALTGKLPLFADLALAAGLAGSGYFAGCLARKKTAFPGWTLPGVCIGALAGIFCLLTLSLKLTHYDNFSHWALIVKYLLLVEELPGAESTMIPFRDYPPGVSLIIYYICRYAGHSQGMMLLAQNGVLFACFFALAGIVEEKRRFLLYSLLGAGCAMLFYLNLTIRINNLLVDFLLPLLALASMAYSCREREKFRLCLGQSLLLGFTGIVKGTGLFFAGVAGVYACWRLVQKEREKGARKSAASVSVAPIAAVLAAVLVMAASLAAPFLLWQDHVRTDLAGFEGKFQIIGDVKGDEGERIREEGMGESVGGEPAGEDLYGQIAGDLIQAAIHPAGRAFQAFVFCSVLTAGAFLYARIWLKRKWKLLRVYFLGVLMLAAYYGGMLYLYLFTMPEEEAVRLAGFSRYACSGMALFAGMLLLCLVKDVENSFAVDIDERGAYRAYSSPGAKRRYQNAVLVTFLLGVNFFYSECSGLEVIRDGYEETLPGRVQALAGDAWPARGKEDPKRYLVLASDAEGQVSRGEMRYVFRYFLWAEDVEVRDIREPEAWEAEIREGKYDRIFWMPGEP